jgi:virginiamycin B lyase
MTEYAIIASLIAVVVIAMLQYVGKGAAAAICKPTTGLAGGAYQPAKADGSSNIVQQAVPANPAEEGMAVGTDGSLWIGYFAGYVEKVSPQGALIGKYTFGHTNRLEFMDGKFMPDGSLWYAASTGNIDGNYVGHINPATGAVIKDYKVGNAGAVGAAGNTIVENIDLGSDGRYWYDQAYAGTGSMGTVEAIDAGLVGPPQVFNVGGHPSGLVAGRDGNVWFAESTGDSIGMINPGTSAVSTYALTTGSAPGNITVGPDGALWFIENGTSKVGRMDTTGKLTNEYALPSITSSWSNNIAVGHDYAVWITELSADKVARVSMCGDVSEYSVVAGSNPAWIVPTAGGAFWIEESAANANKVLLLS